MQLSQNYLYPTIVKCTSLEEDRVFRSYINACHFKQVVLYTYEVYFAVGSVAVIPTYCIVTYVPILHGTQYYTPNTTGSVQEKKNSIS